MGIPIPGKMVFILKRALLCHDATLQSLGFPSLTVGEPDCQDTITYKTCIVDAQSMCKYHRCSDAIAVGIPC